jgi:hypothetical protein
MLAARRLRRVPRGYRRRLDDNVQARLLPRQLDVELRVRARMRARVPARPTPAHSVCCDAEGVLDTSHVGCDKWFGASPLGLPVSRPPARAQGDVVGSLRWGEFLPEPRVRARLARSGALAACSLTARARRIGDSASFVTVSFFMYIFWCSLLPRPPWRLRVTVPLGRAVVLGGLSSWLVLTFAPYAKGRCGQALCTEAGSLAGWLAG